MDVLYTKWMEMEYMLFCTQDMRGLVQFISLLAASAAALIAGLALVCSSTMATQAKINAAVVLHETQGWEHTPEEQIYADEL